MEEHQETPFPPSWNSFYLPMSPAGEVQLLPDAVVRLARNFESIDKLVILPPPEVLGLKWDTELTSAQKQAFAQLWSMKTSHPDEYWVYLRQLAAEGRFRELYPLDQETPERFIELSKQLADRLKETFQESVEVPRFQAELGQKFNGNTELSQLIPQRRNRLIYIATANTARKATYTK